LVVGEASATRASATVVKRKVLPEPGVGVTVAVPIGVAVPVTGVGVGVFVTVGVGAGLPPVWITSCGRFELVESRL
jgi:hypothetical protein